MSRVFYFFFFCRFLTCLKIVRCHESDWVSHIQMTTTHRHPPSPTTLLLQVPKKHRLWVGSCVQSLCRCFFRNETTQNHTQPYKLLRIYCRCQRSIGSWVGSSVVHLGDHNVPNALMVCVRIYACVCFSASSCGLCCAWCLGVTHCHSCMQFIDKHT